MKVKYILSLILGGGFFALTSCQDQPDMSNINSAASGTYGEMVNDTLPAPIIFELSDFEPPEVIKLADPIYDSLSTPFGKGTPDITRYTILDGLPQSITTQVLQGADGMMWFLSVETLSKFDGNSFTTFNRFNGLMEDSYSSDFMLDSKNRIWIATTDGITIYDGRSFTTYTIDSEGNKLGDIESIVEGNDSTFWVGSRENGLFRYQEGQINQITNPDDLDDKEILKLLIDKNGNLIISASDNTLFQYDGEIGPYEAIPYESGSENGIDVFSDSKRNIWFHISGNDEIGKYDGSEITYYYLGEMESDFGITDLTEDGNGNVWLSTSNGLSYFNGSEFNQYTNADLGTSDFPIYSIAFDREGSLWALSGSDVLKINPTLSFREVPDDVNLNANDIMPDPNGDLWIETSNGLGKYEEDRLVWYGHELESDPFFGVGLSPIFDYKSQIWFLAEDQQTEIMRLLKFDGSNVTIYGPEQGLTTNIFGQCFRIESVDKETNALHLNCRNKVIEFDEKRIIQQNFLPDVSVTNFLKDSKGNSWFGTDEKGLYKYDGRKLTQFSTRTGLVSNDINGLAEDQLGNIWATIDYGNVRITDSTISAFNALDGLANLTATITPDSINNVLWFGTISGLVSLDITQLNEEEPRFRTYNYLTGFSIGPIRTPFYSASGKIYGVSGNLLQLDYPALKKLPVAEPYIKNIHLDNQPVAWLSLTPFQNERDSMATINEMGLKFGERLTSEELVNHFNSFGESSFDSVRAPNFTPVNLSLPYKNNTISFEFATVSPTYGASTKYQYRLEGNDDDWSPLSQKTEASFGNLSEGPYAFKLKALNTNGVWSEISYPFSVRPPWYRTWWAYLLYVMTLAGAVVGFISWRTRSLKQDRLRLEDEVSKRTSELEKSLNELKATQEQLVQQEKLASLGQLTAGIAHEIKNPLNFVNNFSDLSVELIEEAREELSAFSRQLSAGSKLNSKKSPLEGGRSSSEDEDPVDVSHVDEALEILNDIETNLRKIHEHGTRADSIVKSMLEHSRGGSGKMESTDLNALMKEFVNLTFHGMRASKNPISVDIEFELDDSIGEVPLIAEDFSRVVINVCNNAFDAMKDKLSTVNSQQSDYRPALTVRTKSENENITIEFQDNGSGIPDEIKDKIMQPFFTTKKGTQGTGLGLSITNDIIKAHGGELNIKTEDGEGSVFAISLPSG